MKHLFSVLFSEHMLKKLERITLVASIAGFLVHLTLVGLFNMGLLGTLDASLFSNPISAIYTPFSFILIYEIYVLIYFLPRSFTTSLVLVSFAPVYCFVSSCSARMQTTPPGLDC